MATRIEQIEKNIHTKFRYDRICSAIGTKSKRSAEIISRGEPQNQISNFKNHKKNIEE
jgi:hypothetical protein